MRRAATRLQIDLIPRILPVSTLENCGLLQYDLDLRGREEGSAALVCAGRSESRSKSRSCGTGSRGLSHQNYHFLDPVWNSAASLSCLNVEGRVRNATPQIIQHRPGRCRERLCTWRSRSRSLRPSDGCDIAGICTRSGTSKFKRADWRASSSEHELLQHKPPSPNAQQVQESDVSLPPSARILGVRIYRLLAQCSNGAARRCL